MSCSSCHCNPCSCDDVCDPNNEPLASALNNFIASFFGSVSKTCVDNQVQWILPCDLNTGLPGFERRQGEGVACYLLRLFEYLQSLSAGISISDQGIVIANQATSIDFTGGGVTATAAGGSVTVNIPCASWYNKIMTNGECYDTWQSAYDAVSGATSPTIMLVGQGSSFGDLNLTANYNSNVIVVGLGLSVSVLGNLAGNGFTVDMSTFNLTVGTVTSAGASVTLPGSGAITGNISTTSGTGGAVVVGQNMIVGNINTQGNSGVGGSITLGREVIAGTLIASGNTGGAVTLGDECTISTITSQPFVAPGTGGTVTIADDCITAAIATSGLFAGTFGGPVTIGDRCEVGNVSAFGAAGGGAIITGVDTQSGNLDSRSTVSGNAGNVTVGRRGIVVSAINCSGIANGGSLTISLNAVVTIGVTGTAGTGNSGPVSVEDGGRYGAFNFSAGTNVGAIAIGKYCTVGGISAISTGGTTGGLSIGDGTSIGGVVLITAQSDSGAVTIGNAVTITGDLTATSAAGNTGGITTGRGCNLAQLKCDATVGNSGAITVGAATVCTVIHNNISGGAGKTCGGATLGAGVIATNIFCNATAAGGTPGNVVLEPGAQCDHINVSCISTTGGNVTLRNSNTINGAGGLAIVMGATATGTIYSLNSRIRDQIDNVNATSWFRDLVGSTPAANRDFIANITASGSQYTNCLIVPNGTGVSINASAPRTVVAYFFLQKNPFPANVSLSEGSDTVSANLIAP